MFKVRPGRFPLASTGLEKVEVFVFAKNCKELPGGLFHSVNHQFALDSGISGTGNLI